MSLIKKTTHCFKCDKGEMIKSYADLDNPAYARSVLTCDTCDSRSYVYLRGELAGMIEYVRKNK